MAETNWIFNLIDRATAPMKQFMGSVFGARDAVEELDATSEFSAKQTEAAIKGEIENRKNILQKIKDQTQLVKELDKAAQNAAPGEHWAKANSELERGKKGLQDLNKELKDSNADIKSLGDHLDKLKSANETFSSIALGFNQFSELAERVSKSLDFTVNIARTRDNIQRMTGATGSALDDVTQRVHALGKTFDEDDDKIALAANAMASQMGVSYNEALELIEKGYDKGANLNGDMLQMLQQYAPKLHEMGLTASESIALMAQAGKQGIPVDKAVDAINKANDAIKERSPATIKALEAIGIDVKSLADKTAFEAQQMISKAMSGATEQQKSGVLKQVFKESGQSVGSGFIEGIASVDMNVDNMPSVVEAGTGFKKVMGDIEGWVANVTGNMGTYIQQFVGVAGNLNNVVGLFASLSKITIISNLATKAWTITQRVLNVVLIANPIGLVITAIGALVGVVIWAWNKFEGFRQVIMGLWEGVKSVFTNIGSFVGDVLSGVWGLLKGVFNPKNWFSDDYSFSEQLSKISNAAAKYGKAIKAGVDKGMQDEHERTVANEKKEGEDTDNPLSATGTAGIVPVLGQTGDNKKGNGKGAKDGMNISGAGGTKAITMNLEIKNYFNNVKGNVREIANQIAGQINDRMRDALVAQ